MKKRLAVHVGDHPREYGKFEGIISQNKYGGGTVMLREPGKFTIKHALQHLYQQKSEPWNELPNARRTLAAAVRWKAPFSRYTSSIQ